MRSGLITKGWRKLVGRIEEGKTAFLESLPFRLVLLVSVVAVLTAILSVRFMPDRSISRLEVGSISPKEIIARRSGSYIDQADLARRRQQASDAVPSVYESDKTALQGSLSDIEQIFDTFERSHGVSSERRATLMASLQTRISFKISETTIKVLSRADAQVLQQLRRHAARLARMVMTQGIRESTIDMDVARSLVTRELKKTTLKEQYVSALSEVTGGALRPNWILNADKTEQARKEALQQIKPSYVPIAINEVILQPNQVVTERHIEMLRAVGLYQGEINYPSMAGILLLVIVGIFLIGEYLRGYHLPVYDDAMSLLLLSIIIVTAMLFAWLLSPILSGYMSVLPILAAVMIVAILLDPGLAMLLTAVLALMLGLIMGNSFQFTVLTIISGSGAVFSVRKIHRNADFVRAGGVVAVLNCLVICTLSLINGEQPATIGLNALFGTVGGLGSAVIAIGGLSFLERPFGLTTHIQLLELCNPNEPLLKKLITDAPGTYHHSIVVGNLAEAAAEAVGADPLLTRVGAYYHDIGKSRRPYFFAENQMNQENAHEKLSPHLSILVITSHVRDGIEMARQHKLPERVVDIITQHHGTSLILYFYHQAISRENGGNLPETQFRYAGPRPRSREAALIMLADSVEAAVRSMTKPTPNKVEAMVRKIIRERLHDGQLDECDLTFRDLSNIADSFVKIMNGIFHPRIEYPVMPDNRLKSIPGRAVGVTK